MADYEQLQREHYLLLNTIREKSMNAAQLMRVAADKTEPHIRYGIHEEEIDGRHHY